MIRGVGVEEGEKRHPKWGKVKAGEAVGRREEGTGSRRRIREKRWGRETLKENASDQHRPSPQRNIAGVMLGTRSRRTVRGDEEVKSHDARSADAVLAPVPTGPPRHTAVDGWWAEHPRRNGRGM